MKFSVVTLFPELIGAWAGTGLVGQSIGKGRLELSLNNPRDFATDVHRSVDDGAFGGSDGMVGKFEPWSAAIVAAQAARIVFLTPQGRRWEQSTADRWAAEGRSTVLVCGRYAGFDNRLIVHHKAEELSIGDYVLNGGEIAAMAVMESVARLLPGVLGNQISATRDSFSNGLLEGPSFTRPREIEGLPVPAPLLSGNHKQIEEFQHDLALVFTQDRRPEIIRRGKLGKDCRSSLERISKLSDMELQSIGITRSRLVELAEDLR